MYQVWNVLRQMNKRQQELQTDYLIFFPGTPPCMSQKGKGGSKQKAALCSGEPGSWDQVEMPALVTAV